MSRVLKWIKRQADTNLVTYSRFGLPGDETDDRPPPTVIHVAPFHDDAPEFLCLRMHSQRAALISAGVGMSMVLFIFITLFFEFDWYHHQRGVDILALLGLLMFAFFGCAIHYYVLYGIRKSQPLFFVPFIVVYTVVIVFECLVFFFTAYHWSSAPYSRTDPWGQPGGSGQHAFAVLIFILFFFGGAILVQAVMLQAVVRCRNYICRRKIFQAELAVAEKSKAQHPGLRIVFGSGDSQNISVAASGDAAFSGDVQQVDGATSNVESPPAYSAQPPADPPTRTIFSSTDESR